MSRPTKISPSIIGHKIDLGTYTLTHKDFILYALGIGFSTDPLNTNDFKYTYELDKKFSTFPTIASCLGQQVAMKQFIKNQKFPEFPFHTVLHGEQRLNMVHPSLKANAKYNIQTETIDVIDRGEGKGVFIGNRVSGYLLNSKGQRDLAFYIDRKTFMRSLGGSGIKSTGKLLPIPLPPKRNPDLTLKEKIYPNQAILYRLNGDANPLHIDPQNAKLAGFPRPIIHGLATYGTVVRSVVQNLLGNDSQRVKSVELRFTGHVFPGESLQIKIWKDGNSLFFQVETVQRKTKAVSGVIGVRESAKL